MQAALHYTLRGLPLLLHAIGQNWAGYHPVCRIWELGIRIALDGPFRCEIKLQEITVSLCPNGRFLEQGRRMCNQNA